MGLFGSSTKAGTAAMGQYDPGQLSGSQKLMLFGAMLRDIGSGQGPQTLMGTQQMFADRQALARKMAADQSLAGMFAPKDDPTAPPAMLAQTIAPKVEGMSPLNLPRIDAAPRAQVPSINDPATAAKILAAGTAGANTAPVLDILKATQPDWAYDSAGNAYNKRGGEAPGHASNLSNVNSTVVDLNDMGNRNRVIPEAPVKGAMPVYDNLGRVTDWTMPQGAVSAIQTNAQATAAGTKAGELPFAGPTAYATTGGRARAEAENDVISIDMPDGSKYQMPRSAFLDQYRVGGTPGGEGVAPGFGQSQTPQDRAAAEVAGKQFAELVGSAPTLRANAQSGVQTSEQGLTYALGLNPNAYTGALGAVAKFIPGADQQNFAGDVATYQRLINTKLRDLAKTFTGAQSEKELKVIQDMLPSLKTPKDAAVLYFAGDAAANRKQQAYADFLANYDGPKDPQAVQRAWMATPEARRSIYQDPIWQKFNMDGGPSVKTVRYKDGKTYGIFRPGTKFQQVFEVIP